MSLMNHSPAAEWIIRNSTDRSDPSCNVIFAATRFGAKIVDERIFEDTGGARRTDSGVALIQRQIPVFTQQAPAYDVLVAADESEVFANYLPYRTWDPRPVAVEVRRNTFLEREPFTRAFSPS